MGVLRRGRRRSSGSIRGQPRRRGTVRPADRHRPVKRHPLVSLSDEAKDDVVDVVIIDQNCGDQFLKLARNRPFARSSKSNKVYERVLNHDTPKTIDNGGTDAAVLFNQLKHIFKIESFDISNWNRLKSYVSQICVAGLLLPVLVPGKVCAVKAEQIRAI